MITNTSVDNILRVWGMADAIDFSEGMIAYYRYRSTLDRIAQHYHISLASVVGMFCSLSPNQAYMTNLRAVISILHGDRGAGYGAYSQLHLYRAIANDQWMLDLLPDDIKPFARQEPTPPCPSTETETIFTSKAIPESQPDLYGIS